MTMGNKILLKFLWLPVCMLCIYTNGAFAQDQQGLLVNLNGQELTSMQDQNASSQKLMKIIHLEEGQKALREVLQEIANQAGLKLSYSKQLIPLNKEVTIKQAKVTARQALWKVLEGTSLRFGVSAAGQLFFFEMVKENSTIQLEMVSGTVTDASTGEPLPGVNVIVKGTTTGTSTNADGEYELTVESLQDTLVFSFVGYQTQEISIEGRNEINIELASQAIIGEDLTVVAYGTQRNREVTGSIGTVEAAEVVDIPANNIGQSLQGRISGLQINQTQGEPGGGGLAFRIRNQASINAGNQPLIVIDGFPTESGLQSISPSEIQEITVLKDASASALYGSRAANGVILITTTQAREGEKSLQISAYSGVEIVPTNRRPDVMNAREFAQFKKEYYEDAAKYEGYTGGVPERYQNPEQYDEDSGTDWFDVLLRDAIIQNYNVSYTNGISDLKSAVDVTYNRQEGVVLNTYFQRLSGRANNTYDVTDDLKLGLNLSLSYRNSQITPDLGGGRNIIGSAFLMDPTLEYQREDGSYPVSFQSPGMFPNPNYYLVATQRENPEKQFTTIANLFAEYEILEGLSYKISGNLDRNNGTNRMWQPSTARGGMFNAPPLPPIGSYGTNNHITWMVENSFTYNTKIGEKHNIDALIVSSVQKTNLENSVIDASEFPDDEVSWINAASTRVGDAGTSEHALESYLARLNYNFDRKYLISAALRYDGSSRFGGDAKWGLFPSISIGWVASDEDFFQDIDQLSFLKLRASYGITGNNNIGNYSYLATVGSSDYTFNDQIAAGRSLNSISNKALSWEETDQYDIGLELGLFDGRVFLIYDYFWKNTKGLLYGIDIPSQSGFQSIDSNIGEFEFWGHEFSLETKTLLGTLSWNSRFNISFNRSLVNALGTNDTPIGGYSVAGDDINRTMVGHPIGVFWGWIYDGVYMTQEEYEQSAKHFSRASAVGSAKFRDINNDGVIDNDDKTVIGDPNPDFIYGFTNNFYYKAFDLSITLAGSVGGDINQGTREWTENLDGVFNVRKEVAERWRSEENPGEGNIARTLSGTTSLSRFHIDRFVFDGSYLQAKNVTLGYTLPFENFNNPRIYFSAQNLFTITNYPGMNPEVSQGGLNGLQLGRDLSSYPVPKIYTLGVNVNF